MAEKAGLAIGTAMVLTAVALCFTGPLILNELVAPALPGRFTNQLDNGTWALRDDMDTAIQGLWGTSMIACLVSGAAMLGISGCLLTEKGERTLQNEDTE